MCKIDRVQARHPTYAYMKLGEYGCHPTLHELLKILLSLTVGQGCVDVCSLNKLQLKVQKLP